ncbi:actin-binding LIM protein 3-like, partial [Engraulis encrasicolus]|uniref:actin-binding LIM protein 3-like n=1 Tax=Engraulis encrasicolus TaxID=184585 RepID=UPI002FD5741D
LCVCVCVCLSVCLSPVCARDLSRGGFYRKSGEYLCSEDYQRLHGNRCARCGDYILGDLVSALGRTYHPTCFSCTRCSKPFPVGGRVTMSGQETVCQDCNSRQPMGFQRHSICAGCDEHIDAGQSLLALENLWHVTCFCCQTCRQPITREYFSRDGIPYCELDYHIQFGIRCDICTGFITGTVLEVEGRHFHPACARCVHCQRMFLEGEELYLTGPDLWHPACKQAERAARKLRRRRASETSANSSVGTSGQMMSVKLGDEYLDYKTVAALPEDKAIHEMESPVQRHQGFYFNRRQRSSSADSYSHRSLSPHAHPLHYTGSESGRSSSYHNLSCSSSLYTPPTRNKLPKHFHLPATPDSNIYGRPPIYKQAAFSRGSSEEPEMPPSEYHTLSPQLPCRWNTCRRQEDTPTQKRGQEDMRTAQHPGDTGSKHAHSHTHTHTHIN